MWVRDMSFGMWAKNIDLSETSIQSFQNVLFPNRVLGYLYVIMRPYSLRSDQYNQIYNSLEVIPSFIG